MRIVPSPTPSTHMTVTKVSSASPPSKLTEVSMTEYIDEVVAMSGPLRTFLWSTILLVVLANAVLLAVFAYLYQQNETNDSLLWLFRMYFLFSNGNRFLMENSKHVALGYAILCVVFVLVALHLVWASVNMGQLRFASRKFTRSISSINSVRVQAALAGPTSVWRQLKYTYGQWHHLFGVRGPYFDYRLLAEEVFEIGGQTIAAYISSRTISNVPLNIIYALVIFLNSLSAFVFRYIYRTSLVKQRLACLMVDLVLDFIWGTLLPIWMYQPIATVYLHRAHVIDYVESFSNSTREIERILILSWKNYVLSIVPFCNSLINLLELQAILREITQQPMSKTVAPKDTGTTYVEIRYPVGRRHHGRFVKFMHNALPLYGIGILFVSLTANGVFRPVHRQADIACMHRVFPWFSTKEACLGRQINCTTLTIDGNRTELENILDTLDQSSLADLYLLSCSGLEMPSEIHDFTNLMSIIIKQSTLISWDENAFLDNNIFHELRTVQMYDVVMQQDPIGFTGKEPIAKSVEWIYLQNIDGVRILSLVNDHWKGLLFFDCLGCGLTTVPDTLYRMPLLSQASLAINDIVSVPDDWIPRSNIQLQMIWFDLNPQIAELPDSLWRQAATCGVFSMSYTNLSIVPEWVASIAGPDFLLTAADTPLCADNAHLSPRVQKLVSCVAF